MLKLALSQNSPVSADSALPRLTLILIVLSLNEYIVNCILTLFVLRRCSIEPRLTTGSKT